MQLLDKKTPSQEQSDDEWEKAYDEHPGLVPEPGHTLQFPSQISNRNIFRYTGHRTTRNKAVALEFESIDGQVTAVKFFNVYLSSRNNKPYPAGTNGQFNPGKKSKFRKFYKYMTGGEPERWCRVHKSLRSKLKNLSFLCTFESNVDGKGEKYFKIIEITILK
ncbi:MAG: hypothetical protein OEW87_10605 [Flavobacteriaceae bacterium]|nr:hypothetical protein [Flavobacteriaceae bacterium]